MRLSSLNIFKTFIERHSQQEKEVKEAQSHPKIVWDMRNHRSWGNKISWTNFNKRAIVGWTYPIPIVGDELICPMSSNKDFKFEFTEVNPCGNPSDMWFGAVKDVGYIV